MTLRVALALWTASLVLWGQGMASRGAKPTTRAKPSGRPWNSQLVDIASSAGLRAPVIYGTDQPAVYISETTAGGIAFFDYDNDGWPDIFVVSGTRLDGNPPEATNRLYRNNHDGTFSDVTAKAGLQHTGWGNGVAVADIDNDGNLDLLVTYWGENVLYRNNGNGTFTDVSAKSGIRPAKSPAYPTWHSGATFVDYDRDGHVDLFIAVYVDFDTAKIPKPGANPQCNWKGVATACGPRGLRPARQMLFHNRGDGTFEDVSAKSGIRAPDSCFALTAVATDLDEDGWPDIYLACDSTPSLFFHNNHDGTFSEEGLERGLALNDDGMEQAGMGIALGDFNNDGILDIAKTHFAEDTHGLYQGLGKGLYGNVSLKAGLGVVTRYIGWGVGMPDLDNDGWPDLVIFTGSVYSGLDRELPAFPSKTPPLLFRNLGGTFELLPDEGGPAMQEAHSSRGAAFADFDNDGDLDIVVWNRNEPPSLLRNDLKPGNHWLEIKLTGTKSNRAAIGAKVTVEFSGRKQAQAVLSQASFTSVNDLRLHFGLGSATAAAVTVSWPSGLEEKFAVPQLDRVLKLTEGTGTALPARRN